MIKSAVLPLLLILSGPYSEPDVRSHLDLMRKDARRSMSVDPPDGEYFYKVTLELKARRVLEIGTSTGYSGAWFAMALKKTGGRLITLEIDPDRHADAKKNFDAMNLADVVDARLCNALVELPRIEAPLDVVFIDAWKPDYLKYYELVLPKVRAGGVILAHNTKNAAGPMKDFLDRIQKDPAVRTEFLPESMQGLSISWKK
ncbi:MAG: class I SAM-dependent methyltransferase [Candidatus Solibacter usitatus]|nr:class I SAM-dependent methyltransferase [Candidatus Solibacter usitatus]